MAGRPRKPTKLHVLNGNPGKRPLPKNEPKPTEGVPDRPEWLLPEAKREWTRVVRELEPLGLLALVDRAMLAAYCQSWATYVRAQRKLEQLGETFETATGYLMPRPEVAIAKGALEKAMQLSARFGFTPADRAKLALPEAPPADPFAEFLNKRKAESG